MKSTSAGLPTRPRRHWPVSLIPFKGPTTNIDLILKENYNQAFLNVFQKIEKNDITEKKHNFKALE